jgi:hypothetical protein
MSWKEILKGPPPFGREEAERQYKKPSDKLIRTIMKRVDSKIKELMREGGWVAFRISMDLKLDTYPAISIAAFDSKQQLNVKMSTSHPIDLTDLIYGKMEEEDYGPENRRAYPTQAQNQLNRINEDIIFTLHRFWSQEDIDVKPIKGGSFVIIFR